ncbi:nuclear transport factor 2 family protein [Telluria sp. B2]|jgi:ketosteroid isomerase-like protein
MDAQENKRLIMEGYRLFQIGDIPALLARYRDDAEWVIPEAQSVPFAGTYHGKAEIAQFFARLDAAVDTIAFTPKEFIAEGDKVVVIGDATWSAKPTGRSFGGPWVHVFTVRDGKIAQFQSYTDTAAAEHAFLPDQPGQRPGAGAPMHH